MTVDVKWFGDKVMADIEKAFISGVNKSNRKNFKDIKGRWPVLTGYSKGELVEVKAVRDGDAVYAMVAANADYSVFIELDENEMPMRRSMMANEAGSLKNFEGALK